VMRKEGAQDGDSRSALTGTGRRWRGVPGADRAALVRLTSSRVWAAGPSRDTPEGAGSVPAGFLFNGALSTYEKLGFTRDWPGVLIGEVGGGHPACRYRPATVLPEQGAPALA
jgi:hypothetical protein